jgi:hypothetical protein
MLNPIAAIQIHQLISQYTDEAPAIVTGPALAYFFNATAKAGEAIVMVTISETAVDISLEFYAGSYLRGSYTSLEEVRQCLAFTLA